MPGADPVACAHFLARLVALGIVGDAAVVSVGSVGVTLAGHLDPYGVRWRIGSQVPYAEMEGSNALPPERRDRPALADLNRVAVADFVFAAMCLAAVALLLHLSRNGTFFGDEWTFIDLRSDWSLRHLMLPHNEHWALVPLLIYNTLFSTVGLGSYLPYQLVLMAAHVAAASAIYTLLRAQNGALPALGGAAILLFLGTGYENLFWPFQIGFVGTAAAGAWAIVLTFVNPSRRRQIVATLLLVVAVATQGPGLFFVAGIMVALTLDADRRRDLWIVAPAVVVYGLWYVTLGVEGIDSHRDPFTIDAVRQLPDYVITGISNAIGQVMGLGEQVGLVMLVALALGTAWHVVGRAPIRSTAVAGFAGLLAQFTLTGLVRAQLGSSQATSPRYVYIAAILLLIVASGWIGRRFAGFRFRSSVVLAVVVLISLGTNLVALRDGRDIFENWWGRTRASVMVIQQYGGTPAVSEEKGIFPIPGQRRLAELESRFGLSVLADAAPIPLTAIDEALYALVADLFTIDAVGAMPPAAERADVDGSSGVIVSQASLCISIRATGADPQVAVLVPGGMALAVEPDTGGQAQVFLALTANYLEARSRRFGVEPGNVYTIGAPDIHEPRPWKLRFDPPTDAQATRICVVEGAAKQPPN